MEWVRLLAYITGTVDQELLLRHEYLAAENRILRAQIKGRLLLSEAEKATLADIGHASGFDLTSKLEFDDVGPVSASLGTGTGSLIGTHTIDQNFMTPPATPAPGLSLSGALTPFASGVLTGTITGLDIDSQNANSDNFTYYIVDD
jgi:hypothetical protein